MYKNYVFDLYGTLIDINTNEWSAYIWKKMQEYYAFQGAVYTPLELKKAYFSTCEKLEKEMKHCDYPEIQIEYVFQQLFTDKEVSISIQQCKMVAQFFRIVSTKYIKVYDGVFEFLNSLKESGKKTYLLSNAQESFTMNEIKMMGLYDYFDGICLSSDESCRKPSSKFFEILFNRYKLQKSESIMIGNDWISDIQGAKNFGIDSLYIHTDISPRDTVLDKVDAKYIIKDADFNKISKLILK